MNTSLSWIKAYVPDLDVTAQEYTDAMTLSGTKVENYEEMDADLDKIVVGQIDKIEKHPDADKLIVCQVNIGTESIQIVTGAPNVHEGDKVPVVLAGGRVAGGHEPGSRVAGGIKIKKATITFLNATCHIDKRTKTEKISATFYCIIKMISSQLHRWCRNLQTLRCESCRVNIESITSTCYSDTCCTHTTDTSCKGLIRLEEGTKSIAISRNSKINWVRFDNWRFLWWYSIICRDK